MKSYPHGNTPPQKPGIVSHAVELAPICFVAIAVILLLSLAGIGLGHLWQWWHFR